MASAQHHRTRPGVTAIGRAVVQRAGLRGPTAPVPRIETPVSLPAPAVPDILPTPRRARVEEGV